MEKLSIGESDVRESRKVDLPWGHEISLEAYQTGDKDRRGAIDMHVVTANDWAIVTLSVPRAREIAQHLLDLATRAESFSTHGFTGSDE